MKPYRNLDPRFTSRESYKDSTETLKDVVSYLTSRFGDKNHQVFHCLADVVTQFEKDNHCAERTSEELRQFRLVMDQTLTTKGKQIAHICSYSWLPEYKKKFGETDDFTYPEIHNYFQKYKGTAYKRLCKILKIIPIFAS